MYSVKIKKQILVEWLQKGNTVERCSEPGPAFGNFITSEKCPFSSNSLEKTSNRLLRDGVISYKTFHHLGMRWERYFLVNAKGENHE